MINIKTNSKKVKNGDIFVAIKGNNVDGHDYIDEAIQNGAEKLIVEKDGKYNIEYEVVENTKEYLDNYLKKFYSKDFNKIKIIGITGTNGKTTTAYLTSQILTNLNINNAYIGTIGFYINSIKEKDLPNTTPEILEIYNLIYEAINKNCEVVIMEISSHALDLNRINGINLDIGVFTNLSQDHLDYHKTMTNYLNTKLKIFNYMNNSGIMIVNNDDVYSKYFLKNNYKTIGYKDCTYNINLCSYNIGRTDINFSHNGTKYNVKTNLSLVYNVYNYLLSLAIVNSIGIDIKDIVNVTKDIYSPKGRFETYRVKEGTIIIDYAHTPDAVEKIINSIKEITDSKIITVIGCGGNRDSSKRPIMGNIVTDNSDFAIFTNDNPREEKEEDIMKDIISGVKKENYEIIYDRKKAIIESINKMEKNDIVLILGKGHEEYQIIGKNKIYFSDFDVISKYIK